MNPEMSRRTFLQASVVGGSALVMAQSLMPPSANLDASQVASRLLAESQVTMGLWQSLTRRRAIPEVPTWVAAAALLCVAAYAGWAAVRPEGPLFGEPGAASRRAPLGCSRRPEPCRRSREWPGPARMPHPRN